MLGWVRLGLSRLGLHDQVKVHYGGQARRGDRAHRLWMRGNTLGVDEEILFTIPRADALEPEHMQGFVAQVLEQACLVGLANMFRP